MSPGRLRFLALAVALLAAACSTRAPNAAPAPTPAAPPTSATSASAATGASAAAARSAAAAAHGSPAAAAQGSSAASTGPRNVACGDREPHIKITSTPARSPDDVAAGSIRWPGLRAWASASPTTNGDPATGDYKLGAEVKAGAVVTVSIPEAYAGVAGLRYGQAWDYSPAQAVTFHGCADSDTAYIGGFHIAGPRCVPLDIAENGKPATRVVVSFFAGPC